MIMPTKSKTKATVWVMEKGQVRPRFQLDCK